MGIAIHYQGQLAGESAFDELEASVRRFAGKHEWLVTPIDVREIPLARCVNGETFEYVGSARGFIIVPHEKSEPIRLLFDDTGFMQESTHTQRSPMSIHVCICELLRAIAPLFRDFEVVDEGGYWNTGSTGALTRLRDFYAGQMDALFDALPGEAIPAPRIEHPSETRGKGR